jgi:hypothetical protein
LYVRDAGVSADGALAAAGAFAGTLARLWALKWENYHKEALWRVAANACWSFPKNAAQRAAGVAMPLCRACGRDMCDGDRRHYFWDCVVARALRENMAMAMLGSPPDTADDCFSRADLWLVQPPAGLAPPVWDVVCLAALSALDSGRQQVIMTGLRVRRALTSAEVMRISVSVIADFWGRLQSYVSLGLRPKAWATVPAHHPFLSRGAGDCVLLVLPDDVGSPPPSP